LNKPSIIFIEEIDGLVKARSDGDSDSSRRVKSELFVQMEGFTKNNGLFVIATTNTPQDLDQAILRRFDKLIYIPLPDESARYQIFQKKFSKHGFSEENFKLMTSKTKG